MSFDEFCDEFETLLREKITSAVFERTNKEDDCCEFKSGGVVVVLSADAEMIMFAIRQTAAVSNECVMTYPVRRRLSAGCSVEDSCVHLLQAVSHYVFGDSVYREFASRITSTPWLFHSQSEFDVRYQFDGKDMIFMDLSADDKITVQIGVDKHEIPRKHGSDLVDDVINQIIVGLKLFEHFCDQFVSAVRSQVGRKYINVFHAGSNPKKCEIRVGGASVRLVQFQRRSAIIKCEVRDSPVSTTTTYYMPVEFDAGATPFRVFVNLVNGFQDDSSCSATIGCKIIFYNPASLDSSGDGGRNPGE